MAEQSQDASRSSMGRVVSWVSIVGVVLVAFVVGAAWIHFRLPGAEVLGKAFVGGEAFAQRGAPQAPAGGGVRTPKPGVVADVSDKTFDGFTLITTTREPAAVLIDMAGTPVHKWTLPVGAVAKNAGPRPLGNEKVHFFCTHLFANGDLLAVYQSDADTPAGYGMVKLDKDSQQIWAYSGNAHHSLDVGEDGKIYTLTNELAVDDGAPERGPIIDDSLVVLSPEGKELQKLRLLKAYRDSPHALTLTLTETIPAVVGLDAKPMPMPMPMPMPPDMKKPGMRGPQPKGPPGEEKGPRFRPDSNPRDLLLKVAPGDVLHANSIRVLSSSMAAKFPTFRANQVLVSMRSISTIAVVDLEKSAVVWSAQGQWKLQHNPEFLDSGRLLIFDNAGWQQGSRVIEFDPQTGATPWCYAGDAKAPFFAAWRGMAQRLPNENTLIVDPAGMRIVEVSRDKQTVWELGAQRPDNENQIIDESVTSAHRYAPGQLAFLKGDIRARP
jgi:Arylsulfotransferase (ASST)